MARWPWTKRTFHFDFPTTKHPDLLERLRGTPARAEDRVRGVSAEVLTLRPEPTRWSIQENLGHLIDLGYLPMRRIDEILRGQAILTAADMANQQTHQADHNRQPIDALLKRFREDRMRLIARLEQLDDSDWGRSGLHPRLKQPMRIVDIVCFDAEHDDYHMAAVGELIRWFGKSAQNLSGRST